MDWVKDVGTLVALAAMIGGLRNSTRILTGEVRLLRQQMARALSHLEQHDTRLEVLEGGIHHGVRLDHLGSNGDAGGRGA